jgi:hypothetical protein
MDGFTPLRWARINRYAGIAGLLEQHGARE